jgi:hypothetical protein
VAEVASVRLFDIVGLERETQAAVFCGGSDHHDTYAEAFFYDDFGSSGSVLNRFGRDHNPVEL